MSQHRKERKNTKSQLYSSSTQQSASCRCSMFSLTMALTFRCANHKLYMIRNEIIYIYLKKNTIKQCENNDQLQINKIKTHLNHFYYTESAISHQQREPVMKMIEAYCTCGSPMSQYNLKRPFISNFKYSYRCYFFVGNSRSTQTKTSSLKTLFQV